MMSALPSAAAHLDYEQPRLGSGIPYSVPRGTYRCADGKWVAISTSAEIGRAPRARRCSASATTRASRRSSAAPAHREELDGIVAAWVGARPSAEVLAAFDAAEAAIAPVYSMHDLLADPHVHRARRVRRGRRRQDARPHRACPGRPRTFATRPTARRRRRCHRLGTPAGSHDAVTQTSRGELVEKRPVRRAPTTPRDE